MIHRYNRGELVAGLLLCMGGTFGYVCAWLFGRHVPAWVLGMFGVPFPPQAAISGAVLFLLVVTASGYGLWRSGRGLAAYHESALYHEMDVNSGGSVMVDLYAHRVTGIAHVLSKTFLSGPLLWLRGLARFRNRIRPSPMLESELAETLRLIESANKWQSLPDYPGMEHRVLMLARMRLIDFSSVRGPRFRSRTP